MSKKFLKNIAASVRMRLLNKARHDKIPFSELLQNYAMDRFLFRLARSTHAEIFILKGALLLRAWHSSITRPTMDIDLLGRTSNDVEHLERIIREICFVVVEPDGLEFDPESIKGDRIVEGADYEGVRLRFNAILDNARIRMQIDVGFGDVVYPAIEEVSLPPMLNFSQVTLRCYSRESTIAEKFEAIVKLGELNSRMKDFFDLWFLSNSFDFSRWDLCEAIKRTLEIRNTDLPSEITAFTDHFITTKFTQWNAFIGKLRDVSSPLEFSLIIAQLREFLEPLVRDIQAGIKQQGNWRAPGPWQ